MRLLLLISIWVSTYNYAFSQHVQVENNSKLSENIPFIEGLFSFDYDGVIHQIKLSSQEGKYLEFDDNGIELGRGKLIRNSRNNVLIGGKILLDRWEVTL